MPLSVSIIDIYGYEIENTTGRNPVVIEAKYIIGIACPFCNSYSYGLAGHSERR